MMLPPLNRLQCPFSYISFQVDLNAHFPTYVCDFCTQSFGVGYHHMDAVFLVVVVYLFFAVVFVDVDLVVFYSEPI